VSKTEKYFLDGNVLRIEGQYAMLKEIPKYAVVGRALRIADKYLDRFDEADRESYRLLRDESKRQHEAIMARFPRRAAKAAQSAGPGGVGPHTPEIES
jgi:hypothetical protein